MEIPDLPPCSCKAEYRHRLHRLTCWLPVNGVMHELRNGLDGDDFEDHVYQTTAQYYYEQSTPVRNAMIGQYTVEVSKEDIEKWAARQLEITLNYLKGK